VVAGDKGVQKAAWRPGRCRRPAHERIGSRAMAKRRLTTLSLSDPCICNNNAAGHGHPRLRYDALEMDDAILPSHLGITGRLVLRAVKKKLLVLRARKDVRHTVDERESGQTVVGLKKKKAGSRGTPRPHGKKVGIGNVCIAQFCFFIFCTS
jgi:hypothetical protein